MYLRWPLLDSCCIGDWTAMSSAPWLWVRSGAYARLELEPLSSLPSSLCHLFKLMGKRLASLTHISSPNLQFSTVLNLSERTAVFFEHHGSGYVASCQHLSSMGVRESFAKIGGTMPLEGQDVRLLHGRWARGSQLWVKEHSSIGSAARLLAVARRSSLGSTESGVRVVSGRLLFLRC
jgi:hypothetical protein